MAALHQFSAEAHWIEQVSIEKKKEIKHAQNTQLIRTTVMYDQTTIFLVKIWQLVNALEF